MPSLRHKMPSRPGQKFQTEDIVRKGGVKGVRVSRNDPSIMRSVDVLSEIQY